MIAQETTSSSTAIKFPSSMDGTEGCNIEGQFYMDGMQVIDN